MSPGEVAVNFLGLAGSRGEDQACEIALGLHNYATLFAAATDLVADAGRRRSVRLPGACAHRPICVRDTARVPYRR